MKKNDIVNHPSHYTDGKIEVIDFIEDKQLGFCLGNAVKYISRAGKKYKDKEIEDLEKAIWYIKRRIKELKDNEQNSIDESEQVDIHSLTNEDINKLKQEYDKQIEEDKIWNPFYKTLHNIDPTYTREEFEKDLEKAKKFTETEMSTLMDFSKILK